MNQGKYLQLDNVNYPPTVNFPLTNLTSAIYSKFVGVTSIGILDYTYGYFYYNTSSTPSVITQSSFSASQLAAFNLYGVDSLTMSLFENDNSTQYNLRVQDQPSVGSANQTVEFPYNISQTLGLKFLTGIGCILNSGVSVPSGGQMTMNMSQSLVENTWENITYNYTVPFVTLAANGNYNIFDLKSPLLLSQGIIYNFPVPTVSGSAYYVLITIDGFGLTAGGVPVSWYSISASSRASFINQIFTIFTNISYLLEFREPGFSTIYFSPTNYNILNAFTSNNMPLTFYYSSLNVYCDYSTLGQQSTVATTPVLSAQSSIYAACGYFTTTTSTNLVITQSVAPSYTNPADNLYPTSASAAVFPIPTDPDTINIYALDTVNNNALTFPLTFTMTATNTNGKFNLIFRHNILDTN